MPLLWNVKGIFVFKFWDEIGYGLIGVVWEWIKMGGLDTGPAHTLHLLTMFSSLG
jgi:hypothetical protein